jgi:hypothetical protein
MCECGCASGLPAYRLPINETSYYAIELYSGCKDCTTPPAVIVWRVEKGSSLEVFFEDDPVLSLANEQDVRIRCGLDPDEHRKAVLKVLVGTKVDGGKIDTYLAEEIADELWEPRYPEVVGHK